MSFFSRKNKKRKLGKGANPTDITAKLANIAYDDPDKRSSNVDGWTYDRSVSNTENAVYVKDGKVIHSSRGTAALKDLKSDAFIVAGQFHNSARAKRSLKNATAVADKYGKENVEYVGHSLGGSTASYLGRKMGNKATTYNAGSGLFRSKTAKSCKKNPNQPVCSSTHYRTGADAVSFTRQGFGKTKSVKGKKKTSLFTKALALGNPFLGATAYVGEQHLGSQFL
tara:strand:+ start:1906 stop:2580 length:675 start_codon:yes stop_codon:yes gene_type:complete